MSTYDSGHYRPNYRADDRAGLPDGHIIGPPNNGKTSVAFKFVRDKLGYLTDDDPSSVPPIIKAETPSGTPSPKALYMALLHAANHVYNPRAPHEALYNELAELFTTNGVRMVIIDEIHNALVGGPNQQKALLNTLKSISNKLRIPVVLIGTYDAKFLIDRDLQIESRFPIFEMPAWELTDDYAQLIDDMYTAMELDDIPSPADDYDFVDKVHRLSGGLTGVTRQLVAKLACNIMETGNASVDNIRKQSAYRGD